MDQRKKSGFTLIELLVVITIILVLMSILGPAILRARENANRASCLSNVRSIGMAMHIFANENNDIYPIDGSLVNSAFTPPTDLLLQAFGFLYHAQTFNDLKVFVCPSNKNAAPILPANRGGPLIMTTPGSRISYSIVLASSDGTLLFRPTTTDPGRNVLLLENPTSGKGGDAADKFDTTDNHGEDGGNVYLINGQAKWWKAPLLGSTAGDGEVLTSSGTAQFLPSNYCVWDPQKTYEIKLDKMLQKENT